jgi:REP element-mobilizing transposase RayT
VAIISIVRLSMVHAYHVIFGAYGFWLPNDPRGSWSDFVASWELLRFGKATKGIERFELTPRQEQLRQAAKQSLRYPPVVFSGIQAKSIGEGFAAASRKSDLSIWACSILPEHVHLVIARHRYKVEQVANLLKGAATKELTRSGLHPLASRAKTGQPPPTPWARGQWKVYLDDEESIENAIHYVEENPVKEGKPPQRWRFVTPFGGLDRGWVTYL